MTVMMMMTMMISRLTLAIGSIRMSHVSRVRNKLLLLLLLLPMTTTAILVLPLPAPRGIHRGQHPLVQKVPADIAGLAVRDSRFVGGDRDAIEAEFGHFGYVAAGGGRGWNASVLG